MLGVLLIYIGLYPVPYTDSIRVPSPEAPVHVMTFYPIAILGSGLMVIGISVYLIVREEEARAMRRDKERPGSPEVALRDSP